MKAKGIGFSLSILIHIGIIAVFLSLSCYEYPLARTIAVDFTILGSGGGTPGNSSGEKTVPGPSEKQTPRLPKREPRVVKTARVVTVDHPQKIKINENTEEVPFSDPNGNVSIHGVTVPQEPYRAGIKGNERPGGLYDGGVPGGTGYGYGDSKGSGGGGRFDPATFAHIRKMIMQNVVYPETARKMGWEGKVTLSFVLAQNGSIQDVKIVQSSGYPLLDESARDAVKKTTFSRIAPFRLAIVLPVEYRLE